MSPRIRLLSNKEIYDSLRFHAPCEACDDDFCCAPDAFRLARWAAKAHALLAQLHWYPDAAALLAEIDAPNGTP